MPGKPSEAKTTIDSLAELLRAKGKMELGKIAQELGVTPSIVENWAKVLEQGSMVKITYEVGKMYVEPITVSKEQETALAATVDAEKVKLENDLALQRSSLDKYAQRLEGISQSVTDATVLFRAKFPALETQLEGINKIYAALVAENQQIDAIKKNAENTYETVNKRINTLFNRIEGTDAGSIQKAKDELQKVQDIFRRAGELESQLTLLSKSKDKALETIKKTIEDQLKSLTKDLAKAQQSIEAQLKGDEAQIRQSVKVIREQAKSLDEIGKQINSFKRDKESVKKSLNDAQNAFNDEYTKASTKMDTTGNALREQIRSMLEEIARLKSDFGEVSKLYDVLQRTKTDIDSLQKKIAQLKQEADKIDDAIRALQTMKGSTEAKARATQAASDKMKDFGEGVRSVDTDTANLAKGLAGGD